MAIPLRSPTNDGHMTAHFDWTTGSLAEGLHCYRTQQFFEAHEHWESVWLTLREPEKSFLQSLVQISAAFHHLRRGNRVGAISLLTRALRRLDRCPASFCGVGVAKIREQVRNWLIHLEGDRDERGEDYPEIEIIDPSLANTPQKRDTSASKSERGRN